MTIRQLSTLATLANLLRPSVTGKNADYQFFLCYSPNYSSMMGRRTLARNYIDSPLIYPARETRLLLIFQYHSFFILRYKTWHQSFMTFELNWWVFNKGLLINVLIRLLKKAIITRPYLSTPNFWIKFSSAR